MIYIKNTNIKIQVSKTILDEVLQSKRFHLELKASKYWRKELIDVKLVNDKLVTKLKDIHTISISNGLHPDLPVYNYECIRFFLNKDTKKFVFQLGDKITKDIKLSDTNKQLNLFNI